MSVHVNCSENKNIIQYNCVVLTIKTKCILTLTPYMHLIYLNASQNCTIFKICSFATSLTCIPLYELPYIHEARTLFDSFIYFEFSLGIGLLKKFPMALEFHTVVCVYINTRRTTFRNIHIYLIV